MHVLSDKTFHKLFPCLGQLLLTVGKRGAVTFSKNRPIGQFPLLVPTFVCLYVPSTVNLCLGLSLALRSHDQFKISHWSAPHPKYIYIYIFFCKKKYLFFFATSPLSGGGKKRKKYRCYSLHWLRDSLFPVCGI